MGRLWAKSGHPAHAIPWYSMLDNESTNDQAEKNEDTGKEILITKPIAHSPIVFQGTLQMTPRSSKREVMMHRAWHCRMAHGPMAKHASPTFQTIANYFSFGRRRAYSKTFPLHHRPNKQK